VQQPTMPSSASQMSQGILTPTTSINPRQPSDDQLYPEAIFVDRFSADSPAYANSCDYSGIPANRTGTYQWFYEAKLITYTMYCPASVAYDMFSLNCPIAITTGVTDRFHNPFTLYGMVHSIAQWSDTIPTEVHYSIMVEVHIKPGFTVNWSETRPWPHIPTGTSFIFPHNFQNATHQPIRFSFDSFNTAESVWYDATDLQRKITDDRRIYQIVNRQPRVRQPPMSSTTTAEQPSDNVVASHFILYSQRTGELVSGNSSDEDNEQMEWPVTDHWCVVCQWGHWSKDWAIM